MTRLVFALCALLVGCGPMQVEPVLRVSADRSTFDGRSERVVLSIRAFDEYEKTAGGLVKLTAPVGTFVGGSELILSEGFVTATFACSPIEEAACLGPIRIQAEWNGQFAVAQVIGYEANPAAPVVWEVVPTNASARLVSAAAGRDGIVWAVGDEGTAVRLIGREWHALYTGTLANLRAVQIGPDGKPVIVGDDGLVLKWTGGGFSKREIKDESLTSLAFDAHGVLHVGAESGLLFIENDEGFAPELQMLSSVRSLASFSGDVWATSEGVLAKFSNGVWSSLPPPVTGRLELAITGEQTLWLAGEREGAHTTQGLLVSGPMPMWKTSALAEPVRGIVEVPLVAERFAFGPSKVFRQLAEGAWEVVATPSPVLAAASRAPGDLVLVGPRGISLLRAP